MSHSVFSETNLMSDCVDNRKEKSLMILAQNFVKLFHCSDVSGAIDLLTSCQL